MVAAKDVEEQDHDGHYQRPAYDELELRAREEDAPHSFDVSFPDDLDGNAGQHAANANSLEDLHLVGDVELVPGEVVKQSTQGE